MPIYDLTCADGHEQYDLYLRLGDRPPCPTCGKPTETLWRASAGVIQDSIEGGVWIKHGICHEDGTPRKYYSKTEMKQEARRRGLVNHVEHVTPPGSDKSKHTTRWV